MTILPTVLLLVLSNVFMTFAWYGHLKFKHALPLWLAILVSWGIAFFEYCLMVPANRYGYGRSLTVAQLKILQEAITLAVFSLFAVYFMKESLRWNHALAFLLVLGAVALVNINTAGDAANPADSPPQPVESPAVLPLDSPPKTDPADRPAA